MSTIHAVTTIGIRDRIARAARIFAAACLLASCAPAVPNITVRSAEPIVPSADSVTMVIVQPATHLHAVDILDGHGQLVAQVDDLCHTVVRLPEGPTLLYAVVGNDRSTADRIEGTLVAGRLYYATVGAREGGVELLTLNPRSPGDRWKHKSEYLAATPRVQMDPLRITRAVNELGDTHAILEAADARVAKLDAAALAKRTIQESDGFFP